jgi:hypothetical protein
VTFDPFGDFATEGYLRNFEKEKDLAIVKRAENASFMTGLDRMSGPSHGLAEALCCRRTADYALANPPFGLSTVRWDCFAALAMTWRESLPTSGKRLLRIPPSLRGALATKQSILPFLRPMDCLAEPVIGRAFARPVRSQ